MKNPNRGRCLSSLSKELPSQNRSADLESGSQNPNKIMDVITARNEGNNYGKKKKNSN